MALEKGLELGKERSRLRSYLQQFQRLCSGMFLHNPRESGLAQHPRQTPEQRTHFGSIYTRERLHEHRGLARLTGPLVHPALKEVESDPGESRCHKDGPQGLAVLDPERYIIPECMIIELGQIEALKCFNPGIDLREKLLGTPAWLFLFRTFGCLWSLFG